MVLILTAVLFVSCILTPLAAGSENHSPEWDGLRVTWGPVRNNTSFFKTQPRTVEEAERLGFVRISECNESLSWRGSRYVKDGDRALTLLYDVNGYIAGIQMGIPKNLGSYPQSPLQPPYVDDGDYWVISAYFVQPKTICRTGRNAGQFRQEGTGRDLYIQSNTNPEKSFPVKHRESELSNFWIRGGCYHNMGQHYWLNVRNTTNCDELFPVFLLYDLGELSAFGWAMLVNITSPHVEHPSPRAIPAFLSQAPPCLRSGENPMSTMHIYLRDDIYTGPCPAAAVV